MLHDECRFDPEDLAEARAVQRQALAFRLQCRIDAMAEHGMESVGISKGFAVELVQALTSPCDAAEEAAYEELEAVSARVQQGWDADESLFDATRLRWLETQARKSRTGISFDWVPPVDGERSGFRFMRRFFVTEQCDTLKAAIDRAMLEDPDHPTDRRVDPAAESARLVAALTGDMSAPCDGSGEAGETAQAGSTEGDSAVGGACAAEAPEDLSALKAENERLQVEKDRLRSECDMLATQASACAEEVDRVRVEIGTVQAENDRLRASLANSGGPCAYCTLPRERWAECASGFPGCARGDDAMLCPHVGAELETREEVEALRLLLRRNKVRAGRERELLAETTRLLERARAAEATLAESERKAITIDDVRGAMWRLQYDRRAGDDLWPAILKARDARLSKHDTPNQETTHAEG